MIIKRAECNGWLFKGLRTVVKGIESGRVKHVIVASDLDKPEISKLLVALGKDKEVDVYSFPDKTTLGEFCGFCKKNDKNETHKVKNCACLGFSKLGEDEDILTQKFEQTAILF